MLLNLNFKDLKRYYFIILFALITVQLEAQLTEAIHVAESELTFSHIEDYDFIEWEKSAEFTELVNAPKLPVVIESFVIPYNSQITNIDVTIEKKEFV